MATNPDWNPLDDEIEEIFAANPVLSERLRDADVRYERGEATLHDRQMSAAVPKADEFSAPERSILP